MPTFKMCRGHSDELRAALTAKNLGAFLPGPHEPIEPRRPDGVPNPLYIAATRVAFLAACDSGDVGEAIRLGYVDCVVCGVEQPYWTELIAADTVEIFMAVHTPRGAA